MRPILALVVLLSSAPALAGLSINGANGITVSGADGIFYQNTNGITVSGADGLLAFNAGSSSLKVELFARGRAWESRARAAVTGIGRDRGTVEVAAANAAIASRATPRRVSRASATRPILATRRIGRWTRRAAWCVRLR